MPAIDPGKLLSTLSVLLGTHGGIKSQEEVERLVTLMDKFSRKMVSKVVYINILKATKPDVLEKFLSEKGWILVNNWFSESIKACNWPLTLELLKLFHICPMTIDRLRENSETNSPPKLVRQLAHNAPNIEKDVSDLAKEVLDKWMTVIQCPPSNPSNKVPAAPLPTRGNRGLATARAGTAGAGQLSTTPSPTPGDRPDDGRVIVTVFTETVEIVRLLNMQCQALEQQEPQFWNGRGGLADKARIKYEKAAAAAAKKPRVAAVKKAPKLVMKITNPAADNTVDTIVAGAGMLDPLLDDGPELTSALDKDDTDYAPDQSDAEDEDMEESDDELAEIMARADRAVNRDRKFPSTISRPAQHKLQNKSSVNKLIKKEDSANSPSSPSANEVKKMETGDKSSIVKDELSQEVDDLLKDDKDDKSIKKENLNSLDVLKDFADGVAKELEKKKELEREKERQKEKERAKERSKEKENKKEKSSSSSHSSDKKKDKHRDKDRERDKERERQREERRRREKEERRRKEKEKERERIRREPKPFKETEMRNGLDSKQKEKIKEVVQRLKDESLSKKKDNSSSPTSEKPKVIKKDIPTVDKAPKSSLSFDALMSAMDTTKKTVKAPPIKNKNRDLLASFSTTPMPVAKKDSKPDKELPNLKDIFNMRTEDKSSKIIPAADFLKERSKSLKRPADTALEAPKLKIKSPSQLKESNGFGDFLSNIMKDDIQPKKKVIKIAELKQKTEEEERALAAKKKEEEEKAESNKSEPESISSGLSFYRDTLEEGNNDDARSNSPDDYSEEATKKASPKPEDIPLEEQVPRVVRGQLVIARGTFRSRKKVTWPEDDANIVAVKYFELDENERVNVNKLKFEEMRKKEFELEKNALKQQTKLAGEEARPWPKLTSCDFVAPEVEYGSQSLEKNAQLQREGSVLQALWFNNTPCNPSEPDNSSTVKFECKDIPLEDDDQEETFQDYSKENWPDPVKDMLAPTNTQDLIFENLQKMMGTGNLQMPNRPVVGIASEMELYKQGLLPEPPKHLMDENNIPDEAYDGGMEMYDQYEEPYQGYEDETMLPGAGMPMDYQGGNQWPPGPFPPQQSGYGGGPMPQQRSNWRGGFRGFPPRGGRGNYGDNRGGGGRGFDSRGGGRGFDTRGRGFDSRGRGGGGGYNDSRGKRGRVCRYWEAKGFCREGDNCLYQHPPKR